jgi:hypothetical protein
MTSLVEQLRGMDTYGYQSQLACKAAEAIENLQLALILCQLELETIHRTQSTNFSKIQGLIISNRAALEKVRAEPTPMSAYGANDMGYAESIEDATYEPADGAQI